MSAPGPRRPGRRVQLQRVFPYGVTYQNGTFRSFFCSEKPHSATHWADNYATVGRIRTMSTQVTEGRYKSAVKTKARKTNNQASFGGSFLQNNMEVEAAIKMALHLDETGSQQVHTGFAKPFVGFIGLYYPNLAFWVQHRFLSSSYQVWLVCTKFLQSLNNYPPFFFRKKAGNYYTKPGAHFDQTYKN